MLPAVTVPTLKSSERYQGRSCSALVCVTKAIFPLFHSPHTHTDVINTQGMGWMLLERH